jgi:hypothetical protein
MTRTTILSGIFLLLVPAGALAGPAERVAISSFQGPQADRIQGAVETGLMTRYYLVPDFNVAAEARRQGVLLRDDDDFGTVGRALDVRAFVSADVQKRDGWRVQLTVRRGDTGMAVGRLVVANRRLDRLESQLATSASGRVRSLLARASRGGEGGAVAPAAVAETAGAAEAQVEEAAPAASEEGLFDLTAGARLFSRSFSYAQNLSALPSYEVSRAVATVFELAVRPGKVMPLPERLRPLRLSGALEYGLGIRSHVAGTEARRNTRVLGYLAGLGYELGRPDLRVVPQVAYAAQTFRTDADPAAAAPDVAYRMLSAGLDARWSFAPGVAVLGKAFYLRPLRIEGLTAPGRFPHATAQGAELEASVAFVFVPSVELRASLGLRRMAFAMHSVPGDKWVAGGAVDQTTWGGLSLAYRR